MKVGVIISLVLLSVVYVAIVGKMFLSVDHLKQRIKEFSVMDFFKVFRGRVYEDNLLEAFVALSLLITVLFVGIAYTVVWVGDMIF